MSDCTLCSGKSGRHFCTYCGVLYDDKESVINHSRNRSHNDKHQADDDGALAATSAEARARTAVTSFADEYKEYYERPLYEPRSLSSSASSSASTLITLRVPAGLSVALAAVDDAAAVRAASDDDEEPRLVRFSNSMPR